MTTIQMLSKAVRFTAVMVDGSFVPFVLFLGLLCMSADIGLLEAQSWMGWCVLLAVALLVIIAALVVSDEHRLLIRSAYVAAVFFLVISLWNWYNAFNLIGSLAPPVEAVVEGSLAILNLTALAMNCPLHLTSGLTFTSIGHE